MDAKAIINHPSIAKCKIRLSTIWLLMVKIEKGEDLGIKSKGRPLSLNSNQENQLIQLIKENPKERFNSIRMKMLAKYKINIHRRTINNYALRNKYRVRKAVKLSNLSSQHVENRMQLAKKYHDLDEKNNFIFSDKKKFLSNSSYKTEYVTRKIGSNAFDEQFINFDHCSTGYGLNIWSYIGPFGKGELFVAENNKCWYNDGSKKPGINSNDLKINRGFDGPSYLHLIKYRALPAIESKIGLNGLHFVQDNASFHKMNQNKIDKESVFKVLNENGLIVVDWPEYSPDLNPIENCWSLLEKQKNLEIDKRIQNNHQLPKNKKEFFLLLKECWKLVDNEKVKNIYNSFFDFLN